MYESPTGAISNALGPHMFLGRNGQGLARRGLLAFDIAGNVPAGATIDSVSLTLNLSQGNSVVQETTLHRVQQDWGEATSDGGFPGGQGAASTPGDATWIHTFHDTDLWTTAGGDFDAAPSASTTVAAAGQYTWGSTPDMVADVQGWLDAQATNFGWLLLGNESAPSTSNRFDTRENDTLANRPLLSVEFTPVPEPSSLGLMLIASVALYLRIARRRV